VVGAFDPALVTATQAAEAVVVFAEIERLAQAGRLLAAGRAASTAAWAGAGDRSAADWLAGVTGQTTADATRDLAAARAVEDLDDTRDALRRGELTKEQVREIAPTAQRSPSSEGELLREARRGSLETLAGKARAARAAARRDGPDALAGMRRRRSFTHGPADDGGHWFRGYAPPDAMARILARLTPATARARQMARSRGDTLTEHQAAFDGFMALIDDDAGKRRPTTSTSDHDDPDHDAGDRCPTTSTSDKDDPNHDDPNHDDPNHGNPVHGNPVHGNPGTASAGAGGRRPTASRPRWAAKVIVNVDLTALRRGYAITGERCEVNGLGPVPVPVVDDLLTRHDTFLAAVLRESDDITQVAHLGRAPNAKQRTALEADHGTCCIDGCADPPAVIDHHHRFADGGPRTLANLGPLCDAHDRRKTYEGWVLVKDGRSRRLVPPDHELAAGVVPGGCIDLDVVSSPNESNVASTEPCPRPPRGSPEQISLLVG
jgi:hypothetical protein